jgi:hypothetical protein
MKQLLVPRHHGFDVRVSRTSCGNSNGAGLLEYTLELYRRSRCKQEKTGLTALIAALFGMALLVTGCPTTDDPPAPTAVNIAAIPGVTAKFPAAGLYAPADAPVKVNSAGDTVAFYRESVVIWAGLTTTLVWDPNYAIPFDLTDLGDQTYTVAADAGTATVESNATIQAAGGTYGG